MPNGQTTALLNEIEGALRPAEQAEYETFGQALDPIAVLQAKARVWLARQSAS